MAKPKTKPKFTSRYAEHTERMSIRVPEKLKNHIWATARAERVTATGVVLAILEEYYDGEPPAPAWEPGTTDQRVQTPPAPAAKKGVSREKDVFA